jgi:hypothetical protein
MTKVKPNTKEQLVDYMLKYLSLGTYDKKFCSNLLLVHVAKQRPVTSNQSDLLDKIVSRYRKQLSKKEIDSNEMVSLPWTLQPIESLPQYTQAHISIADVDTTPYIVIHSPFKKSFVKDVRDLEYAKWDKEERFWMAPATEKNIKTLITLTKNHYDDVNYCVETRAILDHVSKYESLKYWEPTLVKTNGSFYVVATNDALMEAISHFTLNNEPHNIARLVRMGINIDKSLITDKKISLAVDKAPSIEQFDIGTIIDYLLLIKADMVILTEWFGPNKDFVMELANNLKANKIEHILVKSTRVPELNIRNDLRKYEMPVKINLGIWQSDNKLMYLGKTINLVNSEPIDIK